MGNLFIGPILRKFVKKSFHSENSFMAAQCTHKGSCDGKGIIWGYKKPFGDICVLPFFPFMSVCTAGLNDRAFLGRFMSSDIIAPSCSKILHVTNYGYNYNSKSTPLLYLKQSLSEAIHKYNCKITHCIPCI